MINIWQSNVDVFIDTRKKSQTIYSDDTKSLQEHTQIYSDADMLIHDTDMKMQDNMKIKIVNGGTVSTAYELSNSSVRVALLNFADAKRPGGWVIEGAPTQEENICRCTNLYETLIQPKCMKNYYGVNFAFGIPNAEAHYDEPYTDTLMYSENVAIFKDDRTYVDIPVRYVDVITCPAPCGEVVNVSDILTHRMCGIIKSAYCHGVTHIVLGAWGCGAFGQNPKVVAKCFAKVLNKLPVFEEVIFAIRPTITSNNRIVKDKVFNAFAEEFKNSLI